MNKSSYSVEIILADNKTNDVVRILEWMYNKHEDAEKDFEELHKRMGELFEEHNRGF